MRGLGLSIYMVMVLNPYTPESNSSRESSVHSWNSNTHSSASPWLWRVNLHLLLSGLIQGRLQGNLPGPGCTKDLKIL